MPVLLYGSMCPPVIATIGGSQDRQETDRKSGGDEPPTWRTDVIKDYSRKEQADCKAALDRDFMRFFKSAIVGPQRDLLVCHGDVIRYLVTRAMRVDTKAWPDMSVGNASITVIRVQPDGCMKVISVGDVGHIPPNLQSGATGDPDCRPCSDCGGGIGAFAASTRSILAGSSYTRALSWLDTLRR
jgi:hypothetical protein